MTYTVPLKVQRPESDSNRRITDLQSVTSKPTESDATDATHKGLPLPAGNHENASASNAPHSDPDLSAILAAWPTLAEPIKAGILAMIRATR